MVYPLNYSTTGLPSSSGDGPAGSGWDGISSASRRDGYSVVVAGEGRWVSDTSWCGPASSSATGCSASTSVVVVRMVVGMVVMSEVRRRSLVLC